MSDEWWCSPTVSVEATCLMVSVCVCVLMNHQVTWRSSFLWRWRRSTVTRSSNVGGTRTTSPSCPPPQTGQSNSGPSVHDTAGWHWEHWKPQLLNLVLLGTLATTTSTTHSPHPWTYLPLYPSARLLEVCATCIVMLCHLFFSICASC